MQNALTVARKTEITVKSTSTIETVYVRPAKTRNEIIDRIREASACVSDIGLFLKELGPKLERSDLMVANYALARARYRENMDLSIEHVALLAELTVDKVRAYYKRMQIQIGERITNNQASALMSAVADYS